MDKLEQYCRDNANNAIIVCGERQNKKNPVLLRLECAVFFGIEKDTKAQDAEYNVEIDSLIPVA